MRVNTLISAIFVAALYLPAFSHAGDKLRFFHRTDSGVATGPIQSDGTLFAPAGEEEYHHIVLTDRNGTVKVYFDGVADPIDYDYSPGMLTRDRTTIGALVRTWTSLYWRGQIDEVAIFDRVLTAEEVSGLAAGDAPTSTPISTNLVAFYDFEDDVEDSSGYARHGAVEGTTAFSSIVPAAIAGRSTKAFSFDGGNYVSLPHAEIDFYTRAKSTGASLSLWVRAPSQGEAYIFSETSTATNTPLYGIQADEGTTTSDYILWDPSVPVPTAAQAPLLTDVTFHIIKPYEPEVDGYHWLHGGSIIRHQGTWFMTWGNNTSIDENTATEVTRGRHSTNSFLSLTPVEIIASGTESDGNSHGVTLSLNGELWGFFGRFTGFRENTRTEAYRLNDGTGEWEQQGVVMEDSFWACDEPEWMDNGNYITAGARVNIGGVYLAAPAVAISNGDDMMDWTVVRIPQPEGLNLWGETSVLIRGSNLTAIIRGGESRAYVSTSSNYGQTWSLVRRSNLPMVNSKPYVGTLSTGHDYLICRTTADGGNARRPLTIALTDAGGGYFNTVYRIRDGIRPGENSTIEADVSYPYAVEHDGSLYVVYSVGRPGNITNGLELAVIPLKSLVGDGAGSGLLIY